MFVAVYWWRVHPGKEAQFREAWRRGTVLITRIYGSYGSRLHQDNDGRFVGYAEWPDEATWRKAFEARMVYPMRRRARCSSMRSPRPRPATHPSSPPAPTICSSVGEAGTGAAATGLTGQDGSACIKAHRLAKV